MRIEKNATPAGWEALTASLNRAAPRSTTEALLCEMLGLNAQPQRAMVRASYAFDSLTTAAPISANPHLDVTRLAEQLKCVPYGSQELRSNGLTDAALHTPRSPVSLNFFQQRDFRISSWSDQDLRTLPLADILSTEAVHLDTHVPLYHATQVGRWAINHFISQLIKAANPAEAAAARHWLRNPTDTQSGLPRLSSLADMQAYLNDSGIDLAEGLDNRKGISAAFLSCNPSIMQNSDVASEESTADFYYSNLSVNALNATQVESMLSKLRPSLNDETCSELAAQLVEAIHAELRSDRGVLYQFFIPHAEVRDLVYISTQNGIPHPQHADSLDTLLNLQTQDARHLADAPSLQARLYIHPLLDLTRGGGVKLNVYHELTDAQIAAFEHRIEPVIQRLLA